MMAVLKSNEAEGTQDQNMLEKLISKLQTKKAQLETDLGKASPHKIDLSDNTGITNFWKSIVDGTNPKLL
jgi:hypothetical protein